MKEVILHIGRHKTGTTAIQKYLTENVHFLNSLGLDYPQVGKRGYAHHQISELLAGYRWTPFLNHFAPRNELVRNLRSEILKSKHPRIILSSEAFQNCRPSTARSVFREFDTNVVVYVRRQLEYVVSSYAQRVHATDYSRTLDEYIRRNHRVDYWRFLCQWERAFPGKVKVRLYDRSNFSGGCIVRDFLQECVGVPHSTLGDGPLVTSDPNPSLNSKVLLFKLRMNKSGAIKRFPSRSYYSLVKLNDLFPAGNFFVNEECRDLILDKHRTSDAKVSSKYFGEENFLESAQPIGSNVCTSLPESEYKVMLEAFETLTK